MNRAILTGLLAGVYLLSGGAEAAMKVPTTMVCGPVEEMTEVLVKNGEAVAAVATTGPEEQPLTVQFWLSTSTKEWTVMYVADDKACMVSAGKNFRAAPRGGEKPAGQKS